jgi:hypothetical protein
LRTIAVASVLVCLASTPALAQESVPAEPPPPPAAAAPAEPPPPAPAAVPAEPPPPAPAAAAPAPAVEAPPPPRPWVPEVDPASMTPAGVTPLRDTPSAVVEEKPQRSFHFDVGMSTEFPIAVGGYVGVELPGRLLFQLGAGAMPGAYSGAVNNVLMGVGAYDQVVGKFVDAALGTSFVLRASAGWRPFTNHGLELLGGYTLVTMGGSTTEGDIINAVLAEAGASQRVTPGSGATIPLSATLHNVHATVGWRWLLADDHLVIRASLSYLQCVAANVGVSLPSQGQAMEGLVNQQLNGFVSPFLTSYVKTPLVGLSAAYRF